MYHLSSSTDKFTFELLSDINITNINVDISVLQLSNKDLFLCLSNLFQETLTQNKERLDETLENVVSLKGSFSRINNAD